MARPSSRQIIALQRRAHALSDTASQPNMGSMAALARSYLRSADFAQLAPATQRARRYLVETYIVGKWGNLPVVMDRLATKPGTARNLLSMLRVLIAIAIDDGDIAVDPTTGIKRPKLTKEGWHAWTEAEIAQYEAHHPIGRKLALPGDLHRAKGVRT